MLEAFWSLESSETGAGGGVENLDLEFEQGNNMIGHPDNHLVTVTGTDLGRVVGVDMWALPRPLKLSYWASFPFVRAPLQGGRTVCCRYEVPGTPTATALYPHDAL